jgi:hypothetical protein
MTVLPPAADFLSIDRVDSFYILVFHPVDLNGTGQMNRLGGV